MFTCLSNRKLWFSVILPTMVMQKNFSQPLLSPAPACSCCKFCKKQKSVQSSPSVQKGDVNNSSRDIPLKEQESKHVTRLSKHKRPPENVK